MLSFNALVKANALASNPVEELKTIKLVSEISNDLERSRVEDAVKAMNEKNGFVPVDIAKTGKKLDDLAVIKDSDISVTFGDSKKYVILTPNASAIRLTTTKRRTLERIRKACEELTTDTFKPVQFEVGTFGNENPIIVFFSHMDVKFSKVNGNIEKFSFDLADNAVKALLDRIEEIKKTV